MLMPSLAQNPALPCRPGAPGLLYRANDAYIWKGRVQTLFVKDTALRYQYMGEYNVVRALPLSPAEFREWDQNVKVVWARAICDMGKFSKIWARVGLRLKLGREPTEEEIRAAVQKRKGQRNGTKDYGQVPAIVKAYEDGDEVMGVWNMVCIGFKEDLLERIQETAAKFKK
ncbi:hypothetical protein C2E23DRAFT_890355 [Lenzites betulinus]|nr:hypothetical protein C2E23DRAFT_890355 [Lenzites betulinus]